MGFRRGFDALARSTTPGWVAPQSMQIKSTALGTSLMRKADSISTLSISPRAQSRSSARYTDITAIWRPCSRNTDTRS
jgi:hypothetical protein